MAGVARPITLVGEPALHHPCATVTRFDDELATLVDDMFASMYEANGVGLAANQIGVGLRVFVYDCPDDDDVRHLGHVVNPTLEELAPEHRQLVEGEEGCLSVPGPYATLARPDLAIVHGFDRNGEPVTIEGSGFFARCLQHETDHLAGQLYIDRLTKRARKAVLNEMVELRAETH